MVQASLWLYHYFLFLVFPVTFTLGFLYSQDFRGPSPEWHSPGMVVHATNLIHSYHSLTGKQLVDLSIVNNNPKKASELLFFNQQTVVLSHGLQDGPDGPILNYGNVAALKLWGASWEQLTTMPSSHTAEPQNREDRKRFMDQVQKYNLAENYEGVRIALDESRFRIIGTNVWNVIIDGTILGQAATFSKWALL